VVLAYFVFVNTRLLDFWLCLIWMCLVIVRYTDPTGRIERTVRPAFYDKDKQIRRILKAVALPSPPSVSIQVHAASRAEGPALGRIREF
jgi:hypothetical protein